MLAMKKETEEYIEAIKVFAESVGALANFQKQLDYLDTYAEHGDRGRTKCEIYKDFAPHSLSFVMRLRPAGDLDRNGNKLEIDEDGYRFWFNGGLIYYGPGESGVGGPQFSVRLDSSNRHEWRVNT